MIKNSSPNRLSSTLTENLAVFSKDLSQGYPRRVLPMEPSLKLAIEVFRDRSSKKAYLWGYLHGDREQFDSHIQRTLVQLFKKQGIEICDGVVDVRPSGKGSDKAEQVFFGELPDSIEVQEKNGGVFLIRFRDTRHSGLFLDQEPLREWLVKSSKNLNGLNLFCYTGSLSIAMALGGANTVDSVDLSKPTLAWGKQNEILNQERISQTKMNWIQSDAREFLKKATRQKREWDLVLSDPPTFSRSKAGIFSTEKHLLPYHQELLGVVKAGGFLVSSINSDSISQADFMKKVSEAAALTGRKVRLISKIQADPRAFGSSHPLKGGIFQVQ